MQKETEGMGDDSNEDEDVVVAADKKYPAPHTVVVGDVWPRTKWTRTIYRGFKTLLAQIQNDKWTKDRS